MNRAILKILAVLFMVLEHSDKVISTLFEDSRMGIASHYFGRMVFPIFVFLMVEGFFKTSSREKYIKRIFLWAVIMSLGSFILIYSIAYFFQLEPSTLFGSRVWLFRILAPIGRNIFWSLGMGILVLYLIERIKTDKGKKRIVSYAFLLLTSFCSLLTEASVHVLPLFLIFYFFYNKKYAIGGYVLISLLWLINGLFNIEYFWTFEYQWAMIFATPFFIFYNGNRGKYDIKYLFYVIYPLHIWILFIIDRLHILS